mgnify:FL=1
MKKIFLLTIIFSSVIFFGESNMNYMKLFYCVKNNESIRKIGDKTIENFKKDALSAIINLYPLLETRSDVFNSCLKKANNSFEFDSICVLKCLNDFKNDYDYSCLNSCYY